MDITTGLGFAAGFLTTVSFAPQVLKIWKTKSARDVSFGMFGLFSLGVALWLIYGFIRLDLPIIFSNLVTLVLSLAVIILKLRYD